MSRLHPYEGRIYPAPAKIEPVDESLLLVKVAALVAEEQALLWGNADNAFLRLSKRDEQRLAAILAERDALWQRIRCQRSSAMRYRDPLPEWLLHEEAS